ncbi:hypothetical protein EVAR_18414_1 [Eumeta japonica]|uniref:Uncharacterized protein n=1 Tax=Eumeta variegata TaxID=151549 RepID=A0A4C1UVW0_EUMVA|nr:hypothetical protein EVAR_18414_1 [Eumeta japonica]
MQHATHRRPSKLFFHYEFSSNELNIDSRRLRDIEHLSKYWLCTDGGESGSRCAAPPSAAALCVRAATYEIQCDIHRIA